ncbi:hypothetical protein CRG98_037221 [Punica granatum]|uniref:Uncharacterized protein n=1 Tax=Punica granatum TaxID=22663 RepID=A0A2I0IEE3_PUNGR|nr:hypothetical protein CRG98_037221 [Punica granatum]
MWKIHNFFFDRVYADHDGIKSTYKKSPENCTYDANSPKYIEEIRVYSDKLDLSVQQLQAPRRHCCDLLPSPNNKSIKPIFPNRTTTEALEHLFKAMEVGPERILQQTICYDRWFSWMISVSWGYAVQVFPRHPFLPHATQVQETFKHWKKGDVFGFTLTS